MKFILLLTVVFSTSQLRAQSTDEVIITRLSGKLFQWELANNTDSLEKLWNDKFLLISSAGEVQNKQQYLSNLKSGNFIHNNIETEQSSSTVVNGTGTVVGKGKFTVTVSGKRMTLQLSYLEVYSKDNNGSWTLLALHASVLKN